MARTGRPKKAKKCDVCNVSGYGLKFMQFRKTTCVSCDKRKRDLARNALLNRPCKVCGEPIGTTEKRQVVCSLECGHNGRKKQRAVFKCTVCGNAVTRYANHLERYNSVACSKKCQKVLAGKAGKDHGRASEKAKTKWHKERTKSRKAANEWHRRISSWINQTHKHVPKSWDNKLAAMVGGNKHREAISVVSESSKKPKRKSRRRSSWIDKWNEACSEMIMLFNREQKMELKKDPWMNTLAGWVSNHGRRMRIKTHQSQLKDFEEY
jgi:predicted nucleic acid-binding Zn ribbon protein